MLVVDGGIEDYEVDGGRRTRAAFDNIGIKHLSTHVLLEAAKLASSVKQDIIRPI